MKNTNTFCRLAAWLLSLTVALTAMSMTVLADGAATEPHSHCECGSHSCGDSTHESVTYTELTAEITEISADGNYYLTDDLVIADTISVSGDGIKVRLCLNGYTLSRSDQADADNSIITVTDGASFVLCDCSSAQTGTITGGNNNEIQLSGGAFRISGGTMYMYGGKITGNNARLGGGIFIDEETEDHSNGTLHLYGGVITGNTAQYGGGICVDTEAYLGIAGNPKVSGNFYLDTDSAEDVLLISDAVIAIEGAIDAEAEIGVRLNNPTAFPSANNPIAFTQSYDGDSYADRFFSSDSLYHVEHSLNAQNKNLLSLAVAQEWTEETATWSDIGTSNSYQVQLFYRQWGSDTTFEERGTPVTVNGDNKYDFTDDVTDCGFYYFKVKAEGSDTWSEMSDIRETRARISVTPDRTVTYPQGDIIVALTPFEGLEGEIYYTTDGSSPRNAETRQLYTGPITITGQSGATVRVRATISDALTGKYLIIDSPFEFGDPLPDTGDSDNTVLLVLLLAFGVAAVLAVAGKRRGIKVK